jgi:hypothetical protein
VGHVAYLELSYPVDRVSRLLPSTHVRSGSKTSNGIENYLIRVCWVEQKLCYDMPVLRFSHHANVPV